MAIDRTWYNTLVDDDGSGTTGTIWNKAAVDSLLDAVDLLFVDGTWTPALKFGGLSVGMTYGVQTGRVSKVGRLVTIEVNVTLTAKGSSTGVATVTGLPYTAAMASAAMLDCAAGMVGLTGTPFIAVSGVTLFPLQTTATARTQLNDTHFSNTSVFQFGLTFSV